MGRTVNEINKELYEFQKFVEGLDGMDVKDITILSEALLSISAKLARSANLVADATMLSAEAKKNAYADYTQMAQSQGLKFSPSIVKDFVATRCGEEMRCLEYADRMNAALTHCLEALRSCLSSAKEEWKTLKFQT